MDENLEINSTWICDHLGDLIKETYSQNKSFINLPYASPFEQDQINYLCDKFDSCNKNAEFITKEDYVNLLHSLSCPYFIHMFPMIHPTTIVFYKRCRETRVVIESESVCATWIDSLPNYLGMFYAHTDKTSWLAAFTQNIEEIDKQVFQDLQINSGTITQDDGSGTIYDLIQKTIDTVASKLHFQTDKFWVVLPPEKYSNSHIKLTKYLNKIVNPPVNADVYVSRYMQPDNILVGVKDDNHIGYVFAPYCLMVEAKKLRLDESKTAISYYGRKLLREGSKCFGLIKLHESR